MLTHVAFCLLDKMSNKITFNKASCRSEPQQRGQKRERKAALLSNSQDLWANARCIYAKCEGRNPQSELTALEENAKYFIWIRQKCEQSVTIMTLLLWQLYSKDVIIGPKSLLGARTLPPAWKARAQQPGLQLLVQFYILRCVCVCVCALLCCVREIASTITLAHTNSLHTASIINGARSFLQW